MVRESKRTPVNKLNKELVVSRCFFVHSSSMYLCCCCCKSNFVELFHLLFHYWHKKRNHNNRLFHSSKTLLVERVERLNFFPKPVERITKTSLTLTIFFMQSSCSLLITVCHSVLNGHTCICLLLGTDNVRRQKNIFAPNGGYSVYHP